MEFEIDIDNEKLEIEKDGKVTTYDILFTFDSEDTMRAYVGYTDHSIADNGRKNIYVSSYNPLEPELGLSDITNEGELEMINDVLMKIDEENK